MTRLSDIPVRVERSEAAAPPEAAAPRDALTGATIGGGVTAILAEIATALERLAAHGEPTAIDLRSLPMSDTDRARLIEALGPGEVHIALEADGRSSIRETAVHGVWWSEYRDRAGELLAGFIEVARVPGILAVDTDELRHGAERLRAAIGAASAH